MNSISCVVLLLLAVSAVHATFCPGRTYPLTVSTTVGTVQGTYYNGSRAFLGIPFAKSPVGDLRFAQPVAYPKSSSVIQATAWPNACMQASVTTTDGSYQQSEDCLYLNVFTPPCKPFSFLPSTAKLPVMVFIHGGRYWTGYGQQFPGDLLAAEYNAVVISIQYRLNIFGFQAFDSNTNLGLKDQQLALQWVQDNAANFGGDASSVTIFGESAGASAVLYHLIMPSSYNYYKRAIMESVWQWVIPTATDSRAAQATWAATKGCNNGTDYAATLACLKTLPASTINPTTGNANFMVPMIDGVLINSLPLNSIKNGAYNKKAEIVIGNNYDEGNFMAYSRLGFKKPNETITDATYSSTVNKTMLVYLNQTYANQILNLYAPITAQLGNFYGGAQFFGDYYIICGSMLAAQYFQSQKINFRTYIFNFSAPALLSSSSDWFEAAAHGNELPYVFQQPIYTQYEFGQSDYVMAERMGSAWVNFAKYGTNFLSTWWPQYPSSTYFGPNAFGFFDTKPYTKDICANWQNIFELY